MNYRSCCTHQFIPPGAYSFATGTFPVAYQADDPSARRDDWCLWVQQHREALLADVSRHGVVLFRGFPLQTAQDFDAFVSAFDMANFPYAESLSNAVRINRTPRVFTANEAPPSVTIYLHHEMAQTPVYPARLFFFCEQPATTGGATSVCRSDELWNRLVLVEPRFAAACREKGLKYTNVMPPENDSSSGMGRSWQSTLRATTREIAEQRLLHLGYSWTWQQDGSLRVTTPVLPAVRDMPDGRTVFFNQILAAAQGWKDDRNDPSRAVRFGDETPLPVAAVEQAQLLAESLTCDIAWEPGDVACVDNFIAMHGRRAFSGVRKVLASLVGTGPQS